RVIPVLAIKLDACTRSGSARAHNGTHAPRGLAHHPEAVAADVIHMRIDRCDRRGHGNHGFKRIAALCQHQGPSFGRGAVGSGNSAATMSCGVEIHDESQWRQLERAAAALYISMGE